MEKKSFFDNPAILAIVVVLAIGVLAVGLDAFNVNTITGNPVRNQGTHGTRCNYNDDCANPLVCSRYNACLNRGESATPCQQNADCNRGLVCRSQVCATPLDGTNGGRCRADVNNVCDSGLRCGRDNICRIPPGGRNGSCRPTAPFCNQGFTCRNNVCG